MESTAIARFALPEWEMLPDFGLYMDQVVTFMDRVFSGILPEGELTKSMVNNYVKAKLLPRPEGKKYGREHLAMILVICVLKQALRMETVARLMETLFQEGVRAGYERFCKETAALTNAFSMGKPIAGDAQETAGERALRMGITAAICTILTRVFLDGESVEEAGRSAE